MTITSENVYYRVYPADGLAVRRDSIESALAVTGRVERITETTTVELILEPSA